MQEERQKKNRTPKGAVSYYNLKIKIKQQRR